jgi:hypothetical protein
VSAARDRLVLARKIRANADALEQEALTWAAEAAQSQIHRVTGGTAADGSGGYLFPARSVAAELAVAVRESPHAMQRRMLDASLLTRRFPATTAAVREGRITGRYAALIAEHGERLPDGEVLAGYEEAAIGYAEDASLRQTKVFVKTLADRLLPESFTDRHQRAKKRLQGVFVRDLDDGVAELAIVAAAAVIHGAHDRLTSMGYAVTREHARQERAAAAAHEAEQARREALIGSTGSAGGAEPMRDEDGYARRPAHLGGPEASVTVVAHPTRDAGEDCRTTPSGTAGTEAPAPQGGVGIDPDGMLEADTRDLAELRADLAIDLLLAGLPTAHAACDPTGRNALDQIRATVNITIPATTITGLDDETGFLAGHGPIDPDTARRLAGRASGWDRLFRHPDTGVLLTVDRYTPTPAQKRFLIARDETCRFPYCNVLARRADADHTIEYQHGGPTVVTNLAALCEGHHMDKHHTPWTVTQHPGGVLEWTSPLGFTHIDVPQPTRRTTALTAAGPPGSTARDAADPPPF